MITSCSHPKHSKLPLPKFSITIWCSDCKSPILYIGTELHKRMMELDEFKTVKIPKGKKTSIGHLHGIPIFVNEDDD